MNIMRKRGLLIVFEGLDRSGKSTQARLLKDALLSKNMQAELWSYPNRKTSIGQLINSYLLKQIELEDHAVHLLFSANRWETVAEMKEKLASGVNLILDRYAYSGVAYTSTKTGFDFDWCKQCDTGLPKPDLVFFLDTKAINIENREAFGEERYESSDFQKLVYKNFGKIFNLDNGSNSKSDCLVLNAKETIENLHLSILNTIEDTINSTQITELGTLW
jgi:dTMP kinase